MTTEMSFVDSGLRGWKLNVERADKLFGALSPELLEQEVARGKNRLIYLWGHLAAVNDGLLPLLGIGERLHPEFDDVPVEPGQVHSADGLRTIAQSRLARNQPEAVGWFFEVLGLRLGATA